MNSNQKSKTPVIYLFIYRNLKEKSKNGSPITTCEVLKTLRRNFYNMPNPLLHCVLSEMQEYGLIVKIDRLKFKLLATDEDKILNNINNLLF